MTEFKFLVELTLKACCFCQWL